MGPFSGAQLTAIVITLVVMVGFPFAAFAVTGSNVFMTDATSGAKAKVDSGGHAVVGDGTGPLTVDGIVSTRDAVPTKPITITVTIVQQAFTTLYGPVSKPFAIGSLTFTNNCSVLVYVSLYSTTAPGGDNELQAHPIAPLDALHATYPIPLVTTPPTGGTASLRASTSKSDCITVSGVGYQT